MTSVKIYCIKRVSCLNFINFHNMGKKILIVAIVTLIIGIFVAVFIINDKDADVFEKNLFACDEIQSQNDKDWKYLCYTKVAVSKQDISICDEIQKEHLKANCYSEVAASKQNLSICDGIPSQYIGKEDEWLGDYHKVICYLEVAASKLDPSICEMIETAYWRDQCHSNYEVKKAISKKDPSVCDKME